MIVQIPAPSSPRKPLTSGPEEHTRAFPIITALLPIGLAFLWFVSKLHWYWNHKPDMQFGWVVLLLSAFMIWDQWKSLPSPKWDLSWPVVAFSVFGIFLLFLVQIYAAAFGTMPGLLLGFAVGLLSLCAGNIYYVFGWPGLRFFAFPMLFLLIALPLPSAIYNPVVGGLRAKVTSLNVEVLNLFGIPAERVGSLIHLPNGTVGVDEACSGIRSLQSTIMATLFIGYLTLKHRSLQLALFICGIFLAFFGNVVRSLYLSVTANAYGLHAVEKVHDSAGWSILAFTALGVALLAWGLARLEKSVQQDKAS